MKIPLTSSFVNPENYQKLRFTEIVEKGRTNVPGLFNRKYLKSQFFIIIRIDLAFWPTPRFGPLCTFSRYLTSRLNYSRICSSKYNCRPDESYNGSTKRGRWVRSAKSTIQRPLPNSAPHGWHKRREPEGGLSTEERLIGSQNVHSEEATSSWEK